jgi:hypothetical protein
MNLKRKEFWNGTHWRVTNQGIEALGSDYNVPLEQIRCDEHRDDDFCFIGHIANKPHLDLEEFIEAYKFTAKHFGLRIAHLDNRIEIARQQRKGGEESTKRLKQEAAALGYGDSELYCLTIGKDGQFHPAPKRERKPPSAEQLTKRRRDKIIRLAARAIVKAHDGDAITTIHIDDEVDTCIDYFASSDTIVKQICLLAEWRSGPSPMTIGLRWRTFGRYSLAAPDC